MANSDKQVSFIERFLNEPLDEMTQYSDETPFYTPDPNEPTIFVIAKKRNNKLYIAPMTSPAWISWWKERNRSSGIQDYRNLIPVSNVVRINIDKTITHRQRFWTAPPQLKTENGRYVSQAWVMYMCIEENMTPREAMILGYSLLDLKNKRWGCHET